jgi:trehalose utilization protein
LSTDYLKQDLEAMSQPLRVTVWNENRHEQVNEHIRGIYPDGIHGAIAQHLRGLGMRVNTATLDEPEHGLTEAVLEETDVLTWWGHQAHDEVEVEIVDRVQRAVLNGMGLIVLHSGHHSRIFKRLMGTTCDLKWREDGGKERLWVAEPGHPIAEGLGEYIEIPHTEMYGEPFEIAAPDTVVFISWFEGGEVFRSGCCYQRGRGKVFYFRPGHETFPIYYQPEVMQVLTNAVKWATPTVGATITKSLHRPEPLEVIRSNSQ